MLSGSEILNRMASGNLDIKPFDKDWQLGVNSVDCTLGRHLLVADRRQTADVNEELVTVPLVIPDEGLFLEPGFFYLGVTREWVQTKDVVPCIEGVSTAARYGLSVHQTAGFGDAGFMGHFTMEITSCLKLRIYAGMRIAQLYFTSLEFSNGKSRYSGHYGNHYEEDPFPRKPVPGNLTRHLRS